MCIENCKICPEREKDYCSGAMGALRTAKVEMRGFRLNNFKSTTMLKLQRLNFDIEYFPAQDKYLIKNENVKINFFPKSNTLYDFNTKKYIFKGGKEWIKENLLSDSKRNKTYMFTFGKYKSKTIDEVFLIDLPYLNWIVSNDEFFNKNIQIKIISFLNKQK